MSIKHKILVTIEFVNKQGLRYAKAAELLPEHSEAIHWKLLNALYKGCCMTQNGKFDIDGEPIMPLDKTYDKAFE